MPKKHAVSRDGEKTTRSKTTAAALKALEDSFTQHPKGCVCSGCVGVSNAAIGKKS